MGLISRQAAQSLVEKNWRVIDIRTLDSGPEAVRAYFEGVRLGTIEHDRAKDKILELEARTHGMVTGHQDRDKSKACPEDEPIDDLFDLDSPKYGTVKGFPEKRGKARKPRGKYKQ
jgi:hypothetical protein